MYICNQCGKEYLPKYEVFPVHAPKFCSRSCATSNVRNGFYSTAQLEQAIKKLIRSNNRYTTKEEILKSLKISSKTLSKFKISILKMHNLCGIKKPKSVFEQLTLGYLEILLDNTPIECQKTFPTLISGKGYNLALDFYCPKLALVVETDGEQHTIKKHPWYTEELEKNDRIKDEFCKLYELRIIRIPYTKNLTLDYVKEYIHNH